MSNESMLMKVNKESVVGAEPGLEPWQFYGPSTKRDHLLYLHLFAKPEESLVARAIPLARVKSIKILGTGKELPFTRRTAISDMTSKDPLGELIIDTRGADLSSIIPVVVIDLSGNPNEMERQNW